MSEPTHTYNDSTQSQGWVLYDGDCTMCQGFINQLSFFWRRSRFEPIPLQTPWVKEKLGYSMEAQQAELLKEMRVLTQTGQIYGGADAILFLAKHVWWSYPFYRVGSLPGMKALLKWGYQWVAKRRHCNVQKCSINHRSH